MGTLQEMNPAQVRRFVWHLCNVSRRYADRESARLDVDDHLDMLKSDGATKQDVHAKIGNLLEKELKVAELCQDRALPASVKVKLALLQEQMEHIRSERDYLLRQNSRLKQSIDDLRQLAGQVGEHKASTLARAAVL